MYVIRKLINPIEYVQSVANLDTCEWELNFNVRQYATEYADYEAALRILNKVWDSCQICCAIEYANQNDSRG